MYYSAVHMRPNAFVTKPLYEQVRDTLAKSISDGTWQPGRSIPNEIDLARSYGVSVGTMRKALGSLEEEGLLTRRQGRGTFVADQGSGALQQRLERFLRDDGKNLDPDIRQIACDEHRATPEEQSRLRLSGNADVVTFRQIARINHKPAIYREAHIPKHLLGSKFNADATWDVFSAARRYGLWVGSGSERLRLRSAKRHVAKALDVPADTKMIMLDRLVHTLDGTPFEWLVSWSELTDMYYEVSLV